MPINKETIYDTLINPLMAQVIELCKTNGIAMVFSCAIPTEENPGLCCTTCVPDENGKNGVNHTRAVHLLRDERPVTQFRTQQADGSVTLCAVIG